jgi:hypothetical protein
MERGGLNAMPIVGLLSFLIGVVLAYQGADQLRRFGAEIFTVNLVGISVLREMGILLAAILVAGRSGSAYAAEIGTMQVNEEVDAMRTPGQPDRGPRLAAWIALVVVPPLRTVYADAMGIAGGVDVGCVGLPTQFAERPWRSRCGRFGRPHQGACLRATDRAHRPPRGPKVTGSARRWTADDAIRRDLDLPGHRDGRHLSGFSRRWNMTAEPATS